MANPYTQAGSLYTTGKNPYSSAVGDLALQDYGLKTGLPDTSTFVRATAATELDWENIIRPVASGQSRFKGSRVPTNLITASEDMTNGAYADDNNAVSTATQTTFDGTANGGVNQSVTITDDSGGALSRTFVFSVWVQVISGTISADNEVTLRITGTAVTAAAADIGTEVSTTNQRFTVTAYTKAAGTTVIPEVECDVAAVLAITQWQLEEVTGQTNQNPSEYVSTGVGTGDEEYTSLNALSSITDTDATTAIAGVGLGGGNTFESQSSVVSGSDYAVHAEADDTPTANARIYIDLNAFLTSGKVYEMTFDYRHIGTATGNWACYMGATNNGTDNQVLVIANTDTSFTNKTYTFTYGATFRYLQWREFSGANNGGVYVDNLSIKEAVHDSNIDGVKAFDTHNGTTVASNVVTDAVGPKITSSNSKWLYTDGETTSFLSSPDSVAASVTGSIIIGGYAVTAWNLPPTTGFIGISKYESTGTNGSHAVALLTNGKFRVFTHDGVGQTSSDCTAATGFANGSGHWWWVVLDGSTSNFFTWDGPHTASRATAWANKVPLGDADVAHSATIQDSTAQLEVGIWDGNANPFTGKQFRAFLISGADGTADPVVDMNPNDYVSGSTFASATTGETWTINGTATVNNGPVDDDGPFGYHEEGQNVNDCTYSNTWANAAHVATNVTKADNEAVGPTGAKTAGSLTATAGNGTVIQDLGVIASSDKAYGLWIKRKTGTGNIDLGLYDGGGAASWTTVPVTKQWARYQITAEIADPDVGIRIVTDTDAIYVYNEQHEDGMVELSSDIISETTAATRNVDLLTDPFLGADGQGTVTADVSTDWETAPAVTITAVGGAFNSRFIYLPGNKQIAAIHDGSNASSTAAGTSMFNAPQACRGSWGAALTAYLNGTPDATPAVYDGTIAPATIGIGCLADGSESLYGTVRNLKVYARENI